MKTIKLKTVPVGIILQIIFFFILFGVAVVGAVLIAAYSYGEELAALTALLIVAGIASFALMIYNTRLISNYANEIVIEPGTVAISFFDPLRNAMKGKKHERFVLSYKVSDNKIKIYFQRSGSKEIMVIVQRKYLLEPNDWNELETLSMDRRI